MPPVVSCSTPTKKERIKYFFAFFCVPVVAAAVAKPSFEHSLLL